MIIFENIVIQKYKENLDLAKLENPESNIVNQKKDAFDWTLDDIANMARSVISYYEKGKT